MVSISRWAHKHINLSILIIVIGSVLLFFLSVAFSFAFDINDSELISKLFVLLAISVLLIGFLNYPEKSVRKTLNADMKVFLKKWKLFDMILLSSFIFIGLHFGYVLKHEKLSSYPVTSLVISVSSINYSLNLINTVDKDYTTKKKNRLRRAVDRFQMKVVAYFTKKFSGNNTNGILGGLIVLYASLYLALLFGLGALSCNISCNGSPGLAVVVFVLGQLLLFAGLYAAIYGTKNKLEKSNENFSKKKNQKFSIISTLIVFLGVYLALAISSFV